MAGKKSNFHRAASPSSSSRAETDTPTTIGRARLVVARDDAAAAAAARLFSEFLFR